MSIQISNLHFSYGQKKVLSGFSMEADYGQFVYILGPNGVGKSTLFKCILGQLKAKNGHIHLNKKSINNYDVPELAKTVAFIPQMYNPTFNYSVLETVTMGRTVHISVFSSPTNEDYSYSLQMMKKLDIEYLANKGIAEISGGERQLVLIARALVQDARILVMDEPTANLDYGNQLRIQSLMRDLAHEGKLVLQSSHNPQYALQFADHITAIHDGVDIASGKPEEVITLDILKKLYGLDVNIKDGVLIPQI